MLTLPAALSPLIGEFAPLLSKPVWAHAKILLVGAILATGTRTVTAGLRVMGWSQEQCLVNSQRVLQRARWSPLAARHLLRRVLGRRFAPAGEVVFGLDDTSERRRGDTITATGLSRDPGRSSQAPCVKARGLRWRCCMVLGQVAWAGSLWGWPFLTARSPSERSQANRRRTPPKLPERARQIRRWLTRRGPDRQLSCVGDGSFAVRARLHAVRQTPNAQMSTRLRLDAELWHPAPARKPRQNGRPRVQGARWPSPHQRLEDPHTPWTPMAVAHWDGGEKRDVESSTEPCVWDKSGCQPVVRRGVVVRDPQGQDDPHALLSTHIAPTPLHLLPWCVRRWRMAVTCAEARAHLGMETQRQWSDVAIARTTPGLLGLFSLVAVMANHLTNRHAMPVRTAAWYTKELPTFIDALALVRRCLWRDGHFSTSSQHCDVVKVPRSVLERFTDAVCYAA